MSPRAGFVAIARTTFDIPFAEEMARSGFTTLDQAETLDLVGSPELATDTDAAVAATRAVADQGVDALIVYQATFADSTLIAAVADEVDTPLVLWATPEERAGGRLRLNSFCGINLAAYVLARAGVDYRWVYRATDAKEAPAEIAKAVASPAPKRRRTSVSVADTPSGLSLQGKTIGVVGNRPEGFEPSDYDSDTLRSVFGISIDPVALTTWFSRAGDVPENRVEATRVELDETMTGLADVDQESLGSSLQLYLGLSDLVDDRSWSAVATRCWPECFTEFGGAACAGNSMLTSAGTPGCCEADVFGNVTALLLQRAGASPALVADLIDLDRPSNTAAFWHCGLAPKEMAPQGSRPKATIHSNRRKPLLNEFPLRPGRVTIARVSQARNELGLVIGGGEMLDAPLPFSGTSGVARLDSPVDDVLETIMANGLEHHYGIVYGDHVDRLRSYAAELELPVIDL